MSKFLDKFGNELKVGDFCVYAVGQGRAAGGQRFGRVTNPEKISFTNFEERRHWEFDNPDEVAYDLYGNETPEGRYLNKPENPERKWLNREDRGTHWVSDGWAEASARRIGALDQAVKIDIDVALKNSPELLAFCKSL